MEIIILIAVVIGAIYFLLQTNKKPQKKSKAQKQEEIKKVYKKRLENELFGIDGKEELIQKKTKLLQTFSSELSRNLFFDKEEARTLLQELARAY